MQNSAPHTEAQEGRRRRYFAYTQWYASASQKMLSRSYLARMYAKELREVWTHQGKSDEWICQQLKQN